MAVFLAASISLMPRDADEILKEMQSLVEKSQWLLQERSRLIQAFERLKDELNALKAKQPSRN